MMDARARRIIEGGQRLSCVEARVARRSARLGAAAEGGGPGPLGASRLRRPVGGGSTLEQRRHNARLIDLQLKEELHRLPPNNRVARLGTHRRALRDYIHSLDDPSRAQSLRHLPTRS
jgi:hypothetical protein